MAYQFSNNGTQRAVKKIVRHPAEVPPISPSEIIDYESDEIADRCWVLWLQGMTHCDIARHLSISKNTATKYIRRKREETREERAADREEVREELIASLRRAKAAAWSAWNESRNPALISAVMKADAEIARISGVLDPVVEAKDNGQAGVQITVRYVQNWRNPHTELAAAGDVAVEADLVTVTEVPTLPAPSPKDDLPDATDGEA